MQYCKNALCNATDPSLFIKSSKYLCRNCLKQRRDIARRSQMISETVDEDIVRDHVGGNTFSPGPKGSKRPLDVGGKRKGTDNGIRGLLFSQANIITTQQKMIEHQQRQTDALFNLTEKLLTRASLFSEPTISKPEIVESPSASSTLSHELRSKIISHTPRRRQEFVHYKNRLGH